LPAQETAVPHGCSTTPAELQAEKKVDTFRVRGGKLVEHWDDVEITADSVQMIKKLEQQSPSR